MATAMKYTTNIILLVSLLFVSCGDYLDAEMTDHVNPNNFYKTDAQVDQAIIGMYNTMMMIPKNRWFLSEVRSDNVWMQQETVNGAPEICYFLNSDLVSNSQVETAWKEYYKIAANANAIMEHIYTAHFTSEEMRDEYVGEVRFIRALAYFDLVRFFGNIPFSTATFTPESSFTVKQSSAKEVYEQMIIPDLQCAAEQLQETFERYNNKTSGTVGRPTKMAAKALLAEVYVTMCGYPVMDSSKKELAKSLLKEIIDYSEANNNKWWAADIDEWNKMWIHENDNHYFIFEIQADIDANSSQGNTITPYTVDRSWNSRQYGGNNSMTSGNSYGYPYVEPGLRQYFTQKNASGNYVDQRAFSTITLTQPNGGSLSGNVCYFQKFWENKLKRERFGYNDMSASLLSKTSTWPQNFPVIRLENIILYYAELLGRTDEGVSYLNRTRTRAGLTAYKLSDFATDDDYQEAVLNERRYELAEEGHRWFDLVRLNKWQPTLKNMFETDGPTTTNPLLVGYADNVLPFTYLYPIPQQQMQVQEGLYIQNTGY